MKDKEKPIFSYNDVVSIIKGVEKGPNRKIKKLETELMMTNYMNAKQRRYEVLKHVKEHY